MTSKSLSIPSRDKAAICVILLILLGGIAYATFLPPRHINQSSGGADLPLIYAGLPADAGEVYKTFRARVLSDFPLLSQEDKLIQMLSRQGFKSDGWLSKQMTFRRQNGALRGCDFTASVNWKSDDHGRVSALDARFLRTPGMCR